MFQAMQTLLAACASITLSMVANGNGTITVTVIPKANKGGDENASLNTPLSLTGTAEELDAEFAGILAKYSDSHKSLAEQLEATEAILDAAKKEASTKATKAIKVGAKTASATPENSGTGENGGGEHDDDENPGGQTTDAASAAGPAAAKPEKSDNNLWGD